MVRFTFKKGLIFLEGQTRLQLSRRSPTGKLQFDQENGELRNYHEKEVLSKWQTGEWVIDEASLGTLVDVLYLATPRDLSTYPIRHQEEALRRQRYLQKLDPEQNRFNRSTWKILLAEIAEEMGDPHPPAPNTVQGWWRRYRHNKTVISLLPHRTRSRTQKRGDRYAVFEEVLAEVYLGKQQLPKIDVYEAVTLRIKRLNDGLGPDSQIKPISRATIYRWIDQLQQDLVDASRLGADATRAKYRMAIGTIKIDQILARVEIDHTPLDVIVIDKTTKLPIGRAWITLAIDRYSRLVLGFYISFNAPSSYSVLQCLRHAILPKDEWLSQYPDIQGIWPAYGIPDLIAVDNGMDLHSQALEKTCQELGIQLLFCPVATPQHKGSVERFFRTLAEGLIHRLPGTVFSNVDERGDYPSEEVAAIDLPTLTHLITKWIVEVYNVRRQRTLGCVPLDRWLDSASKVTIELPAYPQQLAVITGIPASRTLFHYGLELDGLHYNSRRLQDMRLRAGENIKIQLKSYEEDLGYVHVYDHFAEEYIQVPAVNQDYASGLNRSVHRLVRAHARKNYGEHYSATQLYEAKERIQAIINEAVTAKKMATRKKSAGLLKADSVSIQNGIDPLEQATKPTKRIAPKPPEDLPDGLDDDLPSFGHDGKTRGGDAQ